MFEQLRVKALRPNGASYGLAMEVITESVKETCIQTVIINESTDKLLRICPA